MRAERAPVVAIGYDLSLSEIGMCAIPNDWGGDWSRCRVAQHSSESLKKGSAAEKVRRLEHGVQACLAFLLQHVSLGVKVRIGIEDYAYDKFVGIVLAEMGGVVKLELSRAGYVAHPIVASSARKLALGTIPRSDKNRAPQERGLGTKDLVRTRLTWAGMPVEWSMDQGDAWVVANALLVDGGAMLTEQQESSSPRKSSKG